MLFLMKKIVQYGYELQEYPSPAFALFTGSLIVSGMLFWATFQQVDQGRSMFVVDTVAIPLVLPVSSSQGTGVRVNRAPQQTAPLLGWVPGAEWNMDAMAYINRFKGVAKAEQRLYGIPAGISMAQGLLETNNGKSFLAKTARNHFGIKCKQLNCLPGHCVNLDDDTHKDFFICYVNAWSSWRHHSVILSNNRYKCLKADQPISWKNAAKVCGYGPKTKHYQRGEQLWASAAANWSNLDVRYAYGLQALGYATQSSYAKGLLSKLNTFNLSALTREAAYGKQ